MTAALCWLEGLGLGRRSSEGVRFLGHMMKEFVLTLALGVFFMIKGSQ